MVKLKNGTKNSTNAVVTRYGKCFANGGLHVWYWYGSLPGNQSHNNIAGPN